MSDPNAHIDTEEAKFLREFDEWIDPKMFEDPAAPDGDPEAEDVNPLPVFAAPFVAYAPPLPPTPAPLAQMEVLPQLEPFPVVRGLSFDDFYFAPPSPCPSLAVSGTDVSSAPSTLPPPTPSSLAASPLVLVGDEHMDDADNAVLARPMQSSGVCRGAAPTKREGKKRVQAAAPYPTSSSRNARASSLVFSPASDGGTSLGKITPRRNLHVDLLDELPASPSSSSSFAGPCPYCPQDFTSRSPADYKRHLETHTIKYGTWMCCGVPVALAAKNGYVPPSTLEAAGIRDKKWEFAGMSMVGGCHQNFSRKDALQRHLKGSAGSRCIRDKDGALFKGLMTTY